MSIALLRWQLLLLAATAERDVRKLTSQALTVADKGQLAFARGRVERSGSGGLARREESFLEDEPDPDEAESMRDAFQSQGCAVQRGPKLSGMCSYNKRDTADLVDVDPDAEWKDPRHNLSVMGWKRGFKAKLWSLGRSVTGNRMVHMELPGLAAQKIVRAMYGIIISKVPEACFKKLKDVLTYNFTADGKDNFRQIKQAKPKLLSTMRELTGGCMSTDAQFAKRSHALYPEWKRAAKTLSPIKLGYWGILPELTSEKLSVLAVRVYDELRVLRGDVGLRQIWHYGRCHMTGSTEPQIRAQVVDYKSESQRKWLLKNFVRMYKIMGFRDAHLEWIELDAEGGCLSAPKRDPLCMLTEMSSFSSSNFRMVLMFRERHWQSIGKAVKGFVSHPILSMKKFAFRWKDRWQRGDAGVKLGLVVGPILVAAQIGGIVLGLATSGSSTLATLVASQLAEAVGLGVVMSSVASGGGLISFVVGELFGIVSGPAKSFAASLVVSETLSISAVQTALMTFDDKVQEAILEVKTHLELQVENILTQPRVLDEMEAVKKELKVARWSSRQDEEAGLALEDSLEDEVRRYVEGLVYEEFSQEFEGAVGREAQSLTTKLDPSYGWLSWERWQRFDAASGSLQGWFLRYLPPAGARAKSRTGQWEGEVQEDKKNRLKFWKKRQLRVQCSDGNTRFLELTSETQKWLWVRDYAAYRKATQDYLLWSDWEEYRKGGVTQLKKKEVWYDAELFGCSEIGKGDSCLAKIRGNGNHVVKSISRLQKLLGKAARIKVRPDARRAKPCELELKPEVKRCLRVRDPQAYQRMEEDRSRKEKEIRWKGGQLNSSTRVVDNILGRLKGAADCKTRSVAKTAAAVDLALAEEAPDSPDSEELAAMEEDQEPAGDTAEEERGMREVENTANSALCA